MFLKFLKILIKVEIIFHYLCTLEQLEGLIAHFEGQKGECWPQQRMQSKKNQLA